MPRLNLKLAIFLAFAIGFVNCGQRIDIVLSARDVPKFDFWSESDPYVKLFYKFDPDSSYISYGQTSVSQDNPNPSWPQVFSFDYSGGNTQIVKFELWDEDLEWDDFIGDVVLPLGTIVNGVNELGHFEYPISPSNEGGVIIFKVRIDGTIG